MLASNLLAARAVRRRGVARASASDATSAPVARAPTRATKRLEVVTFGASTRTRDVFLQPCG